MGVDHKISERRELHRQILQETAQHITGDVPERFTVLYFGGPMGSGKTTLLQKFDERIKQEELGNSVSPFESPELETIFGQYKEMRGRMMTPDYALFKKMLPEYLENNDEKSHDYAFALIRAEATGLGAAIKEWARELRTNVLLEELGDGGITPEWLARNVGEDGDLVVVGVTTDPDINLERWQSRDGDVSTETLANTIRGFSSTIEEKIDHARQFALVSTDNDDYRVVIAAKDRQITTRDKTAMAKFLSYCNKSDKQMFQPKNPDQPQADSIGQFGL